MLGEEGGWPAWVPLIGAFVASVTTLFIDLWQHREPHEPARVGGGWPAWLPLVGAAMASGTALFIALWQHRASHESARGDAVERAALTAITASDGESVTVTNFGHTPVFDVRVEAWRDVMGRDGDDGPFISVEDEAYAKGTPSLYPVLGPEESTTFTYPVWNGADGPVQNSDDHQLSSVIKVLLRFSDAAGRRWERQGNGLTRFVRGTPLPGTVGPRKRFAKWRRGRLGKLKRSLKFGFTGKGFTRWGRRRRRDGTAWVSRIHQRCGQGARWLRARCAWGDRSK
ncbi:hypothetical protein ACFT0G_25400 [Streptomyces sp. NPDC057020]|uniref:hypothetical protein n=1 Tax=unclassified Streptomyces TaxID=2593676 RepID=UPI00363F64F8